MAVIPSSRIRYLAEISEQGRDINVMLTRQAEVASELQHLFEALKLLEDPSLPEVLGDAAFFVPPRDPSAMAQECRMLLHDTDRVNRARAAGRRHAAGFTWGETARRTHELYRRLTG